MRLFKPAIHRIITVKYGTYAPLLPPHFNYQIEPYFKNAYPFSLEYHTLPLDQSEQTLVALPNSNSISSDLLKYGVLEHVSVQTSQPFIFLECSAKVIGWVTFGIPIC